MEKLFHLLSLSESERKVLGFVYFWKFKLFPETKKRVGEEESERRHRRTPLGLVRGERFLHGNNCFTSSGLLALLRCQRQLEATIIHSTVFQGGDNRFSRHSTLALRTLTTVVCSR
jgi:hypothetical protein